MATSVQTAYNSAPAIGFAGQLADEGPRDIISVANSTSTGVPAGVAVVRSGDGTVRSLASTDLPLTGTTQIVASGVTTATTAQILTGGTSLNGSVGIAEMWPPRNLVLTLNNNANWDASTIVVEGLDAFGEPIQESFAVPDSGNVVLTGVMTFSKVTAVKIPPQSGTGGTLIIGTGVQMGPVDRKIRGISMYRSAREPGLFAQYEDMQIIRKGRVYASAEAAVTQGDPVYVRFGVTGGQQYGGLGNTPDSFNCARLHGARWASSTTGAGIAVVEINLPAS